MIPYVELRCKSAFSFLTGTAQPEELAARAAELGYSALALTDQSGLYGLPRFAKAARQAGLRPLCGAELRVDGYPLLLLCEDAVGYRNLCKLITREKMQPRAQGEAAQALTLTALEQYASGLIALTGGSEGRLGAAIERGDLEEAEGVLDRLRGTFGEKNLAVELQVHFEESEDRRNATLCELSHRYEVPLVLTNDVRMTGPDKLLCCDVLTCVREGVTLAAAGTRLLRNGERHLKSPAEMAALLPELPAAVAYSAELAARCRFTLADLGYKFPDFPLPPGDSQHDFLRAITFDAAPARFRPYTEKARAQLERELVLIAKLGLSGYFLIVWDIIQFCKSRGILVQGRGSAANSAVCFALSITACDPLKMDLLFERFLSEERGEWPDIDLDLPSGSRREEVIQYLYRKYGAHGCALTANVITYRGRSAVRDIGKVLGFSPDILDKLSAQLSRYEDPESEGDNSAAAAEPKAELDDESDAPEGSPLLRHLDRLGLDPDDERVAQLVQVFAEFQDLPRHIGQHPGGMIIAAGRLDEVVPLQPATMAGRVVIQWDKEDCAELGIVKIDLLGLGMMAALEEAVRLVPAHDGVPFDIAALPENDPLVYRQLQQADTVGVFQVESRAQMAILPRVQPNRFYDLVVQVGLIRPGPIIGKMVHPYLRRRCGQEAVTYPHPSLQPILERTLGIPLFQEQIMRVAMVAAGFSGGQAEQLRRAMDSKRSQTKMLALVGELRAGMTRNGIDPQGQEQIVAAITSFAQYGFPESHAISFAIIAYASAYLKGHHPAVFYTTLLNAWPMGFYHPATLVKDAQRHGVRVRPVEVNASDWRCTIESDAVAPSPGSSPAAVEHRPPRGRPAQSLRIGLRFVRGLAQASAQALLQARTAGPFRSIGDLQRRCPQLSAAELTTLAEIGAFAGLDENPTRRDALWQVSELVASRGGLLTQPADSRSPLPAMSLAERIQADYHGTSITVGPHPMALCRQTLQAHGVQRSVDLAALDGGRLVRAAGLIIVRQRPATARGFFFLTLEDESGLLNLIVAPPVFEQYRSVLLGAAGLVVDGQLQRQHNSLSIKGLSFRDLAEVLQATPHSREPIAAPARNFH